MDRTPGAAARRWSRLAIGTLLGLRILAAAPVMAEELLISAAASLTNGMSEVVAQFQAGNPGVHITCNFAGSGTLLRQLEHGAPVDLLASADQATLQQAQDGGLIRLESRVAFATNTLVLIVTPGLAAGDFGVEDLRTTDGELLAVGNPKFVPAGRYAYEALSRSGLWKGLEGRLVLGNSVRQVLDYVARGEVGTGVVYATDAATAGNRVWVAGQLEGHSPIVYPAAVTTDSTQPQLAGRFLDYLTGETGQSILARHGFKPPPPRGG